MKQIGSNALIIEGGTMRGILSYGILDLSSTQYFSSFDSFWDASAGASNLASFLTNMTGETIKSIWKNWAMRRSNYGMGTLHSK
ncbi:hypothetical protein [Vibrio sagamiensis]|uniref:PNPLA domain-containing protein n=1 Tax=Vibrio sagamiensis NBRC 104589 TaxID=1219064 RepID=A0A511QDF9_9VIBR|nr:hypothetical protein [Vibrio sagamiensis]PNQ64258.1 hypothetical protein C1141_09950 [Vibrio agarivorans]GEM75341.1 hypothetical protein VSA01S_14530 [Vibrio sagamiensis NBRC 104589]